MQESTVTNELPAELREALARLESLESDHIGIFVARRIVPNPFADVTEFDDLI